DPAVTATLPGLFGIDGRRCTPFNVKLEIAKLLLCSDVFCTGGDGHSAITERPFGRTTIKRLPVVPVLAVKQNDCIRRCVSRFWSRCDDPWLWFPDFC